MTKYHTANQHMYDCVGHVINVNTNTQKCLCIYTCLHPGKYADTVNRPMIIFKPSAKI